MINPADQLHPALLESLYAAAAEPIRWPVFLDDVCNRVGARGANLFSFALKDPSFSVIESCHVDRDLLEVYTDHYYANDVRFECLKYIPPPHVITDTMIPDFLDYEHSEVLNEYLLPDDRKHLLALFFEPKQGTRAGLSLHRSPSQGPFQEEHIALGQALYPHLWRAVGIHRRLAKLKALGGIIETALNVVATGVVLLDGKGKVSLMNRQAEELIARRDGLELSTARIAAVSRSADERLQRLIRAAVTNRISGSTLLFRQASIAPLTITAAALPECECFPKPTDVSVVVFIADPEREAPNLDDALATLYQLTPAESRVARGLVNGLSLGAIAERQGISRETARTYLKQVMRKTGARQQSQLVRLLLLTLVQVDFNDPQV